FRLLVRERAAGRQFAAELQPMTLGAVLLVADRLHVLPAGVRLVTIGAGERLMRRPGGRCRRGVPRHRQPVGPQMNAVVELDARRILPMPFALCRSWDKRRPLAKTMPLGIRR